MIRNEEQLEKFIKELNECQENFKKELHKFAMLVDMKKQTDEAFYIYKNEVEYF